MIRKTCGNLEPGNVVKFFVYSGCTDRMSNQKQNFADLIMRKNPIRVAVAKNNNEESLDIIGVSTIRAIRKINGKKKQVTETRKKLAICEKVRNG